MVNIPMVKPMDLRTFFGNASIQLVGYEMPRVVASKFTNSHPNKLMNYVFNMRLTPVEPDALPILDLPTLESEEENEEEENGVVKPTNGDDMDLLMTPPPEPTDATSGTEEEEDDLQAEDKIVKNLEETFAKERDLPASARTMSSASGMGPLNGQKKAAVERTTVGGWLRKKFARINGSTASSSTAARKAAVGAAAAEDLDDGDVNESTETAESMDWEFENLSDLSFCPGCIELNDSKRDGRGKFSYFLALHPALEIPTIKSADTHSDYHPSAPRIKSYSEIAKILPLVPLPKLPKNRRLSPLEKRRRQIVESYRQVIKDPTSPAFKKFQTAMINVTDNERHFLQSSSHFVNERRNTRDGLTSWESAVALVMSRRQYLEQSMVLTVTDLIFRRSSESKRNQIHIPLEHILSVQPLPQDQSPMPDFTCLQIETFARVYTVLLYSDTLVNEWIPLFSRAMNRDCMISPYRFAGDPHRPQLSIDGGVAHDPSTLSAAVGMASGGGGGTAGSARLAGHSRSATLTNDSINDREEFFLAHPACWKLDKRRVFNYRRIYFKPIVSSNGNSSNSTAGSSAGLSQHPCNLVASLLSAAFYLSHMLNSEQLRVSDSDWVRFWDELSLLQTISLVGLSEPEKMAFFLNLYHVMVVHGSMVFGPPPTWSHWNAFYNHITYIVAGELVSIAEIEYCILKANMSRSYMFASVAMPAPPTSTFPHLALSYRDFRLHFAINCGSLSNIHEVPIYTPELLDSQLDMVTRLTLEVSLEIDVSKKTITMSRLPMVDYQSTPDLIYFPPSTTNVPTVSAGGSGQHGSSAAGGGTGQTPVAGHVKSSVLPSSGMSPLPATMNTTAGLSVTTAGGLNTSSSSSAASNQGIPAVQSDADLVGSSQAASSSHPSVIEATQNCLYALMPYLSKSQRAQMRILLQDPKALTVRYRQYNFKCIMLEKLTAYRSSSHTQQQQLQQQLQQQHLPETA
jgi:hypothetical protein